MRLRHPVLFIAAVSALATVALAKDAYTPPDPAHIPFILPKDIKWVPHPCTKKPCGWGDATFNAFGDPSKPGMYGQFVKWSPGFFSTPHSHDQARYIIVVSGTWWVSSSSKQDMSTLYPLPAGTVAQDIVNTVHWDGAKAGGEPAIIEVVGMGPVSTVLVEKTK